MKVGRRSHAGNMVVKAEVANQSDTKKLGYLVLG